MRLGIQPLAGLACAWLASSAAAQDIHLNEIFASHTGTDDEEFIELVGPANASLDGYVVCIVEGDFTSSGTLDRVWDLTGSVIPADGYFVLGDTGLPTTDFDIGAANRIENGTETFYLIGTTDVAAIAALEGMDVDPDGNLLTDLACLPGIFYLEIIAMIDDDLNDRTYDCAPEVGPDGTFFPAGIFRPDDFPNDFCGDEFLDFGITGTATAPAPTPGTPNSGSLTGCTGVATTTGCESVVLINEVDCDTVGTDMLEFVELTDRGCGNTPLDGLVVVFFNGSDDASYEAFDLDGFTTDADGYFLIGNTAVSPDIVIGTSSLQNGADAVALFTGDAADFPNDTPVTDVGLIDAVVYDTSDADAAVLLAVLTPGQPQLNEGGNGNQTGESNQRCGNGDGYPRTTTGWIQYPPTPRGAPTSLGTNYCLQNANSTGLIGRIRATGSLIIDANDLTLIACDLPLNENGYFLVSPDAGFIDLVTPGLSAGNFCLGGGSTLGRYFTDVQNTGDTGTMQFTIDVLAIPQADGDPVAIMDGETWFFQGWYRDGAGNNFTDGIELLFLSGK